MGVPIIIKLALCTIKLRDAIAVSHLRKDKQGHDTINWFYNFLHGVPVASC